MLNKKTQLTRSARTVLSFYPRTLLAYSLYFQTLLLSYPLLLSYSSIFILSIFTHSLPPAPPLSSNLCTRHPRTSITSVLLLPRNIASIHICLPSAGPTTQALALAPPALHPPQPAR